MRGWKEVRLCGGCGCGMVSRSGQRQCLCANWEGTVGLATWVLLMENAASRVAACACCVLILDSLWTYVACTSKDGLIV